MSHQVGFFVICATAFQLLLEMKWPEPVANEGEYRNEVLKFGLDPFFMHYVSVLGINQTLRKT